MRPFADTILAEFKTRKAAEKYCLRVIGGAEVKVSSQSKFDMYWPKGKPVYQVCYRGAAPMPRTKP